MQQGNQNLTRKIVVHVDIGQAPVRLEALPLLPNHIGNFAVNTLVSRIGIADLCVTGEEKIVARPGLEPRASRYP